jgi:hypothetical protein
MNMENKIRVIFLLKKILIKRRMQRLALRFIANCATGLDENPETKNLLIKKNSEINKV